MTTLDQRSTPGFFVPGAIVIAYLFTILVGILLIRSPIAMPAGSELSVPRSVFTIINAATLTGFGQTVAVDTYRPAGQVVIFVMMIAGSLASMIVGGAAVVRLVGLPYSMMRVVLGVFCVEMGAIVTGTIALYTSQRTLFAAMFQAASAFGNCGVVIGPAPGADDAATYFMVIPLAVLGGLGLPVLLELFDWIRGGRAISAYSRTVLALAAGVFLIATIVLVPLHWPDKRPTGTTWVDRAWLWLRQARISFPAAATAALNSRSLGWPLHAPAQWPRAMQWFVMLLMIIGAAPAGTGGGVKTTCVLALSRGTFGTLRGRFAGRVFGIAIVWLGLYSLVIAITMLRLLRSENHIPADQLFFITTSAVGNVGLSPAPISITGVGLHTLSGAMLLGRILPMVVLWWAALTAREADLPVA